MTDTADNFLHAIALTLLMPFFLPMTGDIERARLIAGSMIQRLLDEGSDDLIAIAQTVAFGLASLNTLALANGENLDARLTLRINASAAALTRCQERAHRKISAAPRPKAATPPPPRPESTPQDEKAIQAEADKQRQVSRDLKIAARKIVDAKKAQQKGLPIVDKAAAALRIAPDKVLWAYRYAQVAEECIDDPQGYANGNRHHANLKARMLNTCAYDALCGVPPDTSALPPQLRPRA